MPPEFAEAESSQKGLVLIKVAFIIIVIGSYFTQKNDELSETNSQETPLKIGRNAPKGNSSNHPFSDANCQFQGGYYMMIIQHHPIWLKLKVGEVFLLTTKVLRFDLSKHDDHLHPSPQTLSSIVIILPTP